MKAILLIFSLGLALGINRGPHSLTLFESSYSAVGEIDHYIPTINASFLGDYSEIHLDAPTERLFWEQTLIKFWMFSDSNYLIFPDTPDICFTNTGFNFGTMNEKYSFATSFDLSINPRKVYTGLVEDLGSCCDTVAVNVAKFNHKLIRFRYSQHFPSFAPVINDTTVNKGVVVGDNRFYDFGPVNESKFDIPTICQDPISLVEYCPVFYYAWGWCDQVANLAVPYETTIP
jgi:hypothetical protein